MTADATPSALNMNLIERVCVGDVIPRSASLYAERIAMIEGDREITYAQFAQQVDQLGHALLGLGLKHQDVVCVASRNSIEFLITYFACARAGLICMPLNLALQPKEMLFCLGDAKARVLIAEGDMRASLSMVPLKQMLPSLQHLFWFGDASVPDEENFDVLVAGGSKEPLEVMVADRDIVQLMYTSGTTANPKGVLTSHVAVMFAALSNIVSNVRIAQSVDLVSLPLFHCAMLNGVPTPSFIQGGTLVLLKAAKTFDPEEFANLLERRRVKSIVLLPMMYAALVNHPACARRTFPDIQRAVYAMAPMAEPMLARIHAMFPNANVVQGAGQTEFTPATSMIRAEHQWSKAGSWGTATATTRIAIMDEHGKLLPCGETGEIVYRGPQCMQAYLNQPEETQLSFAHGWFHSGDIGRMDEDGAVWFMDRHKDIVKSGGENVSSVEVERCLLTHPDVLDAAVVGVPHERWGEAVVAAVIPKPGKSAEESSLIAHCRDRLAGFKVPKKVVHVDELPRTGTGKIQKHHVRTKMKDLKF